MGLLSNQGLQASNLFQAYNAREDRDIFRGGNML